VTRFAIGYSATSEEPDRHRPMVVFIENGLGVLVLHRGELAPRLVDDAVPLPELSQRESLVKPGDPRYFDVILDSFSTNWVIRTVSEFDPQQLVSSMLLRTDEAWEALPSRALVPA
jgi:hypothetical protein